MGKSTHARQRAMCILDTQARIESMVKRFHEMQLNTSIFMKNGDDDEDDVEQKLIISRRSKTIKEIQQTNGSNNLFSIQSIFAFCTCKISNR